jgi:hypothetical protein
MLGSLGCMHAMSGFLAQSREFSYTTPEFPKLET